MPDDVHGPIQGVLLHKSLHHGCLTKSNISVGFSGENCEQTIKQPKVVFSRLHRARCLNTVPGYCCKIAEHCKQILFSAIANCWVVVDGWRERTKMDRVISILASGIVDLVEFRRVLDGIKLIPWNTTDKCSEYNPKIGPQSMT